MREVMEKTDTGSGNREENLDQRALFLAMYFGNYGLVKSNISLEDRLETPFLPKINLENKPHHHVTIDDFDQHGEELGMTPSVITQAWFSTGRVAVPTKVVRSNYPYPGYLVSRNPRDNDLCDRTVDIKDLYYRIREAETKDFFRLINRTGDDFSFGDRYGFPRSHRSLWNLSASLINERLAEKDEPHTFVIPWSSDLNDMRTDLKSRNYQRRLDSSLKIIKTYLDLGLVQGIPIN